ncbi:hypothetical protein [Paenibacillus methanolicus]|uniref:Uncharacterized protein n=1 Tax=Paenibacillus methanolicus TaxID=582686 RepID=A0A5S5BKU4_9BACL|nr:hypothetical protein [Paenibacillus methanolicus]TYP67681.1 hypothetical protein BCM02_1236 [Paenibacillus methanolicus]
MADRTTDIELPKKPASKLTTTLNVEGLPFVKSAIECLFFAVSIMDNEQKDKALAKMAAAGIVDGPAGNFFVQPSQRTGIQPRLGKELKQSFVTDAELAVMPSHLIVAVLLPTGAVEIIYNTQELPTKLKYYIDQYDEEFRLRANPDVEIVDYMLV